MRLSVSFCVPLCLLFFTTSALLHIEAAEPRVSLSFGSKRNYATSYVSNFANNEGIGFSSENPGLLAVGYFKNEKNIPLLANTVTDSFMLHVLLENFQLLAYVNFNNRDGGYAVFSKKFQEKGVGKKPYLLLLDGVTNFDDALNAKGVALFSDSSFSNIPTGNTNSPTFYLLLSSSYDEIFQGKVVQKSKEFQQFGFAGNYVCTLPVYESLRKQEHFGGVTLLNSRIDENLPVGTSVSELRFYPNDSLFQRTPGKILWDFKPPNQTVTVLSSRSNCPVTQVRLGAITSEPVVGDDGTVYIGCTNEIYALDGETMNRKWRYRIRSGPSFRTYSLCLSRNGTLYFASSDNKVYALNAVNGRFKWKSQIQDTVDSIYADENSHVYVSSQQQTSIYRFKYMLSKLSAGSGELDELLESDSAISIVDVTNEHLLLKNGNRITSLPLGEENEEVLYSDTIDSITMGPDGILYAVLFDNSGKYSVAAIGSTTGTVIWETPMSSKVGSPVFGENGKLFVISSSNELISINQSTGSVLWSSVLVNQDDSNQITGSIMGKDKVLYCTLNEGKLISFDTLTRTVFWEGALLHKGPSKPVISNQGILYIGVQDSDTSYLRSLCAMQTPHSQTTPEYQPNSTFQLVNGEGDSGNSNFYIIGHHLLASQSLSFEEQSHFSIRLKATWTDSQQEQIFTIAVNDLEEAPSSLQLTQSRFPSNAPDGYPIGTLSVIDDDHADEHSYEILSSFPTDVAFQIEEAQLVLSDPSASFRTAPAQNYEVEIQVEDKAGLTFLKKFILHKYRIESPVRDEVIISHKEEPQSPSPVSIADSDFDGVPDLLEYALGGSIEDPNKSIPPQEFSRVDGKWCIEFVRLKPALEPDLFISLQMCEDLFQNKWEFVSFSSKGPGNGVDQSNLPDGLPYSSSQYGRIQLTPNTLENANLDACFFRILVSTP